MSITLYEWIFPIRNRWQPLRIFAAEVGMPLSKLRFDHMHDLNTELDQHRPTYHHEYAVVEWWDFGAGAYRIVCGAAPDLKDHMIALEVTPTNVRLYATARLPGAVALVQTLERPVEGDFCFPRPVLQDDNPGDWLSGWWAANARPPVTEIAPGSVD